LYEFSPDALSRLLEGAGFKITQLECEGRPALLYTLGASGFCDGLKRRLKHGGRYRFDWRLITSVPKLIGVGLVLLPAFVYGILADRRRRTGHRISVIAKRPSSDCAQERDSTASTEHEATPGPRPTPKAEMPGEHEADILGIRFDLLSCTQALATIESWRRRGKRRYVTFSNPHSVMMSQRDDRLSRAFAQAGMTLPDGTGIIAAANLLGYRNQGRVAGPSFMLACCDWGRQHGYRHYFCGGGDGVAEALAARLAEQYPGLRVVGTCSPPFRELSPEEDEALVARVNAAKPDIVWVGLGAPKQERWMAAHAAHVKATAMMGVGAAFDFHAGKTSWAPRWVRRLGIEWAYRLACEPRRMWRRNLDSPLFLFRVLQQWMRRMLGLASRRNPPRSTSATSVQPDASEELT
jgi:N-acetylglucosaminyldiphosphoundecaprenol N-acetyl-beta-D-mannosaminyltransferase